MNNIKICRFYFYNNLRIIAPVDEGHHLNVLSKLSMACASQPTRSTLPKRTSARKGPNKSISPNKMDKHEKFIIRSKGDYYHEKY